MTARTKRHALAVTPLEDRSTPALFGLGWVNAQSLTVSFAPDGTDVGGASSTLSASLGRTMPQDQWQTEIRRAFQAWVPATNVNFRLVGDDRAAFGADAPLAGVLSRGDIRIAARPLSDNVFIISNPPDVVSDWAGEIVLNSNTAFTAGGADGTVDLYTAMLQEVGHVLGVGNSTDPGSVMYETYLGPRAGLSAGDVAAAQALYGARTPDRFEGRKSNDFLNTATAISYVTAADQLDDDDRRSNPTLVRADLSRPGDVDSYSFSVPSGQTGATNLLLRASDASQLAGTVYVVDWNGKVITRKAADGPGRDVALSVALTAGKRYFVVVEGADARFNTGAYRLSVGSVPTYAMSFSAAAAFLSQAGLQNTTTTAASTLKTAVRLGAVSEVVSALWDTVGSFTPSAGAETVFSINTVSTTPANMLVSVWAGQLTPVNPRVRVMDDAGNTLAVTPLRADGYNQTVQLTGAKPNTLYYVAVTADKSFLPPKLGLGMDFRADPIRLQTFATGTLSALANEAARPLTVSRSQLFRFELTGLSLSGQQEAYAELTVRDAAGRVLLKFDAGSGQTLAEDVFLTAGAYTVSISGATTDGSPLTRVSVTARLTTLTDPIGPAAIDDAAGPLTVPPTSPPPTSPPPPPASPPPPGPDGNRSAWPSDPGYVWDPFIVAPSDFLWW